MLGKTIQLVSISALYGIATVLRCGDAPRETPIAALGTPTMPHEYIVSGERLVPGPIVQYVYRREGQADLTLRFRCRRSLPRFKADPERYPPQCAATKEQDVPTVVGDQQAG